MSRQPQYAPLMSHISLLQEVTQTPNPYEMCVSVKVFFLFNNISNCLQMEHTFHVLNYLFGSKKRIIKNVPFAKKDYVKMACTDFILGEYFPFFSSFWATWHADKWLHRWVRSALQSVMSTPQPVTANLVNGRRSNQSQRQRDCFSSPVLTWAGRTRGGVNTCRSNQSAFHFQPAGSSQPI